MPKPSGMAAPPTPWMTRPRIITWMFGAIAATPLPIANTTRTQTKTRCLPNMSPTRPRIGVQTEAESRNAVSTQVTVCWLVCSSCWILGRIGETIDWASA